MTEKRIASVTPIGAAKAPKAMKNIVSVTSDIEAAIPRDQWDRPKILPPGGGDPVAYRRASSVVEALESHYGLHKWELRLAAEGLAKRPDLVQAVQLAAAKGDKREVGNLVEEALEFSGRHVAARNGSTMHGLTEHFDKTGDFPPGLPVHIEAMLEAYAEAMKDWEVLDTERFVVQDKIKVAGTYDKRLRHRKSGLIVIGDTKTGQAIDYMTLKVPAQIAVYATGDWYDLDGDREAHGADRNRGLLIHMPWTDDLRAQPAECELRWVDLRVGRVAVMQALRIDKMQKMKHHQTLPLYRG